MRKTDRAGYFALTCIQGGIGLCNFCKYASFRGSCEEADLECEHPLNVVKDNSQYVWEGWQDCWGFRPRYTIEVAADITGILLQGLIPDWNTVDENVRLRGVP